MDRYRALTLAGTLTLAVACAASAGAQTAPEVNERLANQDAQGNMALTPYVDGRRENLQGRINAGTADGSLTSRETARLQRQETHITREEARFKLDGTFTPAERQHVVRDENRVSRHIARQRHDAQRRSGTN